MRMTGSLLVCLLLASLAPAAQSAGADAAQQEAARQLKAGRGYLDQKEYAKAVDALKRSIALAPTGEANNFLGQAYEALDKTTEAMTAYAEAIRLAPNHSAGYHNIAGIYLFKLKDYEKAVTNYRAALRLEPGSPNTLNSLGVALFRLQRYAEAVDVQREAVRLAPDNATYQSNLGWVYLKLNRIEEAAQAHARLVVLDKAKALDLLVEIHKVHPTPQSAALLAEAAPEYVKEGDASWALARQMYEQKLYPKGNDAYDAAVRSYRRAIEYAPSLSLAYQRLGELHLHRQSYTGAADALKPRFIAQPDDGAVASLIGMAYLGLEKYAEAIAAHEQAIRSQPRNRLFQYRLGLTYVDMGRVGDALKIHKALLASDQALAQQLRQSIDKLSSLTSNVSRPATFPNPMIELVAVPPGTFIRNSQPITIAKGFHMGKFPVTQAQWQAVMGDNPSFFKNCGGDCPVEQVSWNDAQEFIRRLNMLRDGYTYRLPSEAEWEYAYRAGTTGFTYADGDIGWASKNSGGKTHPVGAKPPNAFGLYDMAGHVQEWCLDWWAETYSGAPTDGSPRLNAEVEKYRVLRGASFYVMCCASATRRTKAVPYEVSRNNGFRVVAEKR